MKIITGLIGTGKTVAALRHCEKNNLIYVVHNIGNLWSAKYLVELLKLHVHVITHHDLLTSQGRGIRGNLYLDSPKLFLQQALNLNVEGMTIDGEDVEVRVRSIDGKFYATDLFGL